MGLFSSRESSRTSAARCRPSLEKLEDRTVPAFLATDFPVGPPLLSTNEVDTLLQRASAATPSEDGIIAVVDRMGNILGVRVEAGVSPAITGNPDLLAFAIDGAVAKARTAAFFGTDQAPLTSRTIQNISQTTITQREVQSNPNINDPNSPLRGPGFVAPVRIGAHFPPEVPFTPPVDLFGIEHTNRDSILHPGADALKGTADDVPLAARFNINPAFVPAGQAINPPISYGEAILTPAQRLNPAVNHYQSRGIATLPGGIPIYEYGTQVGGIGVFFPGQTGFATEENSQLSSDFNPNLPDRTLEAEFMALAAIGGSRFFGYPIGAINGVPALPGFDVPGGRIDLVGVTLDVVGPGGNLGPANLVKYVVGNLQPFTGNVSGANVPVDGFGNTLLNGVVMPSGWLVTPHDGVNLSAAEVTRMVNQAIDEATKVRAQIRLPSNQFTKMTIAVTDSTGEVLGLFRMQDGTVFSIDVAVAKARNVSYYNDGTRLQPQDQVPGLPPGAAITNRTIRFLAEPRFPEGIDGQFGDFSILNDPGTNPVNGFTVGAPQPANAFQSVLGYDAFNPGTNFRSTLAGFLPQNQNGIVFFPGSSGVYKDLGGQFPGLVGGLGVSGDGVDQDDVVTSFGIMGFQAPRGLRADDFFVREVRLPYQKFPRNPEMR